MSSLTTFDANRLARRMEGDYWAAYFLRKRNRTNATMTSREYVALPSKIHGLSRMRSMDLRHLRRVGISLHDAPPLGGRWCPHR